MASHLQTQSSADAQQVRAESNVASTSHQGLSYKGEDDKLTNGGRVLVVHDMLEGKGAKGGKGRRRGRFIILGAHYCNFMLAIFRSHRLAVGLMPAVHLF